MTHDLQRRYDTASDVHLVIDTCLLSIALHALVLIVVTMVFFS